MIAARSELVVIVAALMLAGAVAAIPAHAQRAAPDDTAAVRIVEENCEICHSRLMVDQQRLSRDAWLAEINKMRGWGAPLTDDQIEPLVSYLAIRYGADAPPLTSPSISAHDAIAATAPSSHGEPSGGDARRGRLAYQQSCATCHGDDARGILGPNLVQQPILYQWPQWRTVVMGGRHKMPGFAGTLGDRDLADLLAWTRSLRVSFVGQPAAKQR